MHFHKTLLAFAVALTFTPSLYAAIVPDGAYSVTYQEEGVALFTSISDSTLAPIKVKQEIPTPLTGPSAKFTKRRTDCWGNGLNHDAVDAAGNALRGWANNGHTLASGNTPTSFGYVLSDVYVYYCIAWPNSSGNLDINDVNYAFQQMDAKCAAYTGSWFGWDNTPEIVGKASTSQHVCV